MANLPAEITHLYEEAQAKDREMQECRAIIANRDQSLQKFVKLNGGLVQNPKEEPYTKIIMQNFERAQILQEEKVGLVEKAITLVTMPSTVTRLLGPRAHLIRWTATSNG